MVVNRKSEKPSFVSAFHLSALCCFCYLPFSKPISRKNSVLAWIAPHAWNQCNISFLLPRGKGNEGQLKPRSLFILTFCCITKKNFRKGLINYQPANAQLSRIQTCRSSLPAAGPRPWPPSSCGRACSRSPSSTNACTSTARQPRPRRFPGRSCCDSVQFSYSPWLFTITSVKYTS